MLVYRVETRRGKGPYVWGNVSFPGTATLDKHPLPEEDGMDVFDNMPRSTAQEYVFAFESMESLLRWFDKEYMDALLEHNKQNWDKDKKFRVYVYEVPLEHVEIGYNQVAFNKSRAFAINTIEFEQAILLNS